eukprot:CAMPEP_0168332336 /NCGR_PEP_ID=MMETSP0213-20121227/8899_1 /TAXON_ID=151035 /ORGANISM="Euplotes harpa, Strain FSP1.4" /LENGTH=88 /DNA_ID=CAMNT_0008336345 /DNA_START=990 /DNA_END=1256 /DNA_ORIENTATION=+
MAQPADEREESEEAELKRLHFRGLREALREDRKEYGPGAHHQADPSQILSLRDLMDGLEVFSFDDTFVQRDLLVDRVVPLAHRPELLL